MGFFSLSLVNTKLLTLNSEGAVQMWFTLILMLSTRLICVTLNGADQYNVVTQSLNCSVFMK